MKNLTLKNIANACGGTYYGDEALLDTEITNVTQDSRTACAGSLFLAVKGEKVDGHRFIPQVFEKGAACVLAEDLPENAAGPCIIVPSTLEALKEIAEFYRNQLTIPIIGITGSVGKTSTKEMIASVLSQHFNTLKTQGNFNNEIGVPLTLLRIQDEHEAAVIEMGINHFGEMHRLSKMARPDICVFTNIGLCHLEFLGTRDGILKAKTEMFDFAKEGAPVIANGDDDKLITLKDTHTPKPTYFGLSAEHDFHADKIENLGLLGTRCEIVCGDDRTVVEIPIAGDHMIYNALAGAAVGRALGLSWDEIRDGIAALVPVSGRNHLIRTEHLVLLDDCYNANPVSMCSSLDVLARAMTRKVAILGDMGELGKDEKELHASVGTHAAKAGIDVLIAAGPLSYEMAEAAKAEANGLEVHWYPTRDEMCLHLKELIREGDSCLIKASHFMQFESIVAELEKF